MFKQGPIIRDAAPGTADERFITTCSHVDESEEIDRCAERRRVLFDRLRAEGARFKVAVFDDALAGFIHGVPIRHASWGAVGENLMMIPCLFVRERFSGRGVGRALVEAVEAAARRTGTNGVAVVAYRDLAEAAWFMPAPFFDELGFEEIERRGHEALLWRPFLPNLAAPRLLRPDWSFQPVSGKVVVDLFWNEFCPTSSIEARRVREVAREFGDNVIIREYQAEDRSILLCHQTPRAVYINGREIGWGYEAPREGIRNAIRDAFRAIEPC